MTTQLWLEFNDKKFLIGKIFIVLYTQQGRAMFQYSNHNTFRIGSHLRINKVKLGVGSF